MSILSFDLQKPFNVGAASASATAVDRCSGARLAYLDDLRAFAILSIVILHAGRAYFIRGFENEAQQQDLLFILNDIVFRNGTLYFTFVSGVIYAHSFRDRHLQFLSGRLRGVVAPFLIVSSVLSLLFGDRTLLGASLPETAANAASILLDIATGEAFYTLWYIPVIMVIYLLGPTLIKVAEPGAWRGPFLLLTLCPMVFSRTATEFSLSSVLYFTGAYVLGLRFGLAPDRCIDWLFHRRFALVAVAAASSLGLFALFIHDLGRLGPVDLRESGLYVQKMSLCGLLVLAFAARPRRAGSRIDGLAAWTAGAAFAIYFLHAPAIRAFISIAGPFGETPPSHGAAMLAIAAIVAVTLLGCAAVVALARAILGRRARWVIGA